MAFRDETLILRERLGELDAEHATLEAQIRERERALAVAQEEHDDARRALATLPRRGRARTRFAQVLGALTAVLGFIVVGGGCLAGLLAATALDHTRILRRVDGTGSCELQISGRLSGGCDANLRCGELRYEGVGECRDDVSFWDHDDGDGNGVFAYVEHVGAVWRTPAGDRHEAR